MSVSSRSLDRFATTFDHEGLVANAGLILAATLMDRLGLLGLIERWVRTGSANPGPKDSHAGRGDARWRHSHRSCRDAARGRHRSGAGVHPDGALHGGVVLADLHVRPRPPTRSGAGAHAGACLGTGRRPRRQAADGRSGLHDLRGPRQAQGRRRYGYTKVLGYHPLLAARADTREVLAARMRKGSAGSARGVVRFVDEVVANLRRAGATGEPRYAPTRGSGPTS